MAKVIKYDWKSGDRYYKLMLTGKSYWHNSKRYVECICDCGTVLFKRFDLLKSGWSRLCGNKNCRASENIIKGEQYGRLTLTGVGKRDGNYTYAEAICDCGNIVFKRLSHIDDGRTNSCGVAGCKVHTYDRVYEKYKDIPFFNFTLTGNSLIINGVRKAEAICKCGNIRYLVLNELRKGNFKSCGCMRNEYLREIFTTHGLSKHPVYHSYRNMINRCYDENDEAYKNYGGRGIMICDEWLNNITTFYEWAINNGWSEGLEIDRIDNDGNYDPSNCRWTTPAIQNRNKRNNRNITAFGETKCITAWSEDERCVVSKKTILSRIRKGVSEEMAISIKKIHNASAA